MALLKGIPLIEEIPVQGGIYILFLSLLEPQQMPVGRYGISFFPKGLYAYVGSAHGSGGLAARLKHHLGYSQKPHWHIDWVRPFMQWVGLYYETNPLSTECTWSKRLSKFPGTQVIIPGFGASDCRQGCHAHFYRLNPSGFGLGDFIHYFSG